MQPSSPTFPRRGPPHTFGCVRVPEKDHYGWLCWERPGGSWVWMHHTVGVLVQASADVLPEPESEAVKR